MLKSPRADKSVCPFLRKRNAKPRTPLPLTPSQQPSTLHDLGAPKGRNETYTTGNPPKGLLRFT